MTDLSFTSTFVTLPFSGTKRRVRPPTGSTTYHPSTGAFTMSAQANVRRNTYRAATATFLCAIFAILGFIAWQRLDDPTNEERLEKELQALEKASSLNASTTKPQPPRFRNVQFSQATLQLRDRVRNPQASVPSEPVIRQVKTRRLPQAPSDPTTLNDVAVNEALSTRGNTDSFEAIGENEDNNYSDPSDVEASSIDEATETRAQTIAIDDVKEIQVPSDTNDPQIAPLDLVATASMIFTEFQESDTVNEVLAFAKSFEQPVPESPSDTASEPPTDSYDEPDSVGDDTIADSAEPDDIETTIVSETPTQPSDPKKSEEKDPADTVDSQDGTSRPDTATQDKPSLDKPTLDKPTLDKAPQDDVSRDDAVIQSASSPELIISQDGDETIRMVIKGSIRTVPPKDELRLPGKGPFKVRFLRDNHYVSDQQIVEPGTYRVEALDDAWKLLPADDLEQDGDQ